MPGSASSCSFVAVFKSTKAVLEAAEDFCDDDFAAEGDWPLVNEATERKNKHAINKTDSTGFRIIEFLLYCGFFSFFAAWYPALTASASDMYLPFLVFP